MDSTGAGTAGCPWLLRAAPWQRINITLIDFTAGLTAETAAAAATGWGGGGDDAGVAEPDSGQEEDRQLPSSDVDDGKLSQPPTDRGRDRRPPAYGGTDLLPGSGRSAVSTGYKVNSEDDLGAEEVPYRRVGDHTMTRIGRLHRLPKHHHRNNMGPRGFSSGSRLPYIDADDSAAVDDGVGHRDENDLGESTLSASASAAESVIGSRFQVLHRTFCHKYAVVWERFPVGGGNGQSHSGSGLHAMAAGAADAGPTSLASGPGQRHGQGHGRGTVVCGDVEREKVVYLSTSNEVELELARPVVLQPQSADRQTTPAPEAAAYFLLYYESMLWFIF